MAKAAKLDYEINNNGCFVCTSHKAKIVKKNYETIRIWKNGRAVLLHRWVYEEMYGQIPSGLVVRHKCDNSKCINPEHLELGTQKENVDDMIKRGRAGWQRKKGCGQPVNYGDK